MFFIRREHKYNWQQQGKSGLDQAVSFNLLWRWEQVRTTQLVQDKNIQNSSLQAFWTSSLNISLSKSVEPERLELDGGLRSNVGNFKFWWWTSSNIDIKMFPFLQNKFNLLMCWVRQSFRKDLYISFSLEWHILQVFSISQSVWRFEFYILRIYHSLQNSVLMILLP